MIQWTWTRCLESWWPRLKTRAPPHFAWSVEAPRFRSNLGEGEVATKRTDPDFLVVLGSDMAWRKCSMVKGNKECDILYTSELEREQQKVCGNLWIGQRQGVMSEPFGERSCGWSWRSDVLLESPSVWDLKPYCTSRVLPVGWKHGLNST